MSKILNVDLKDYIKRLAISTFNEQYGKDYDTDNFDVISIKPNNFAEFGYEIFTNDLNDYLRLRVYFTIGRIAGCSGYVLHDEVNKGLGYGDELYVADFVVDEVFLKLNNNFVRREHIELVADESLINILLAEDGINGYVPGDDVTDFLELA